MAQLKLIDYIHIIVIITSKLQRQRFDYTNIIYRNKYKLCSIIYSSLKNERERHLNIMLNYNLQKKKKKL